MDTLTVRDHRDPVRLGFARAARRRAPAPRRLAAHPPGLDDGLTEIASCPDGWLLFSLTGLGLMAFG